MSDELEDLGMPDDFGMPMDEGMPDPLAEGQALSDIEPLAEPEQAKPPKKGKKAKKAKKPKKPKAPAKPKRKATSTAGLVRADLFTVMLAISLGAILLAVLLLLLEWGTYGFQRNPSVGMVAPASAHAVASVHAQATFDPAVG